ncbi:Basic-leucine zipper (bZIP) transcription factor [Macrophomina phaseolina MS6]|uniref:Basic-leucine zipper (BZIP) transcription factor n=1 Tax=Macrophomina phaseolina (strain MS6) TaxID=1126212 RepID=K2RG18_MACPH|nr:Basic-leucine zipper (bZIP) transcription factor [Macrophomina phaseolina MS6]
MAGTTNNQFNSHLYLSPNQQDLLMAALNSNNPNGHPVKSSNFPAGHSAKTSDASQQQPFSLDGLDPTFFPPDGSAADFGNFNLDESPYADFLDGDGTFEFDPNDTSDLLIGSLPGDQNQQGQSKSPTQRSADDDTETGDKRKSPADDHDEDGEGGGKRREGEDKTAKKPGRKPLTSEPTTKRKAQNRAAQRAFRERKEKHLKDLESKVTELQKASDAANHENGLLRAQVERLQMELREYRKRLSLNSTGISRPTAPSGFPSLLSHNSPPSSNFQFEFPRFGALPGSQIFNSGSLASGDKSSPTTAKAANQNSVPGVLARQSSAGRSVSPTSQHNGARSDKASPASGSDTYTSPSLNGVSHGPSSARGSTSSSTGPQRVFQFNSHSNSTNDSPSASSVSQYGANSSCGTSPEPSHNSPSNDKSNDHHGEGFSCTVTEASAAAHSNSTDSFGIDWLASQNNNQFNPTLFGDYRESQAAVVGEGDFTGGFFNDAFPTADFGSPFNFDNQSPGTSKSNPVESIEKVQDGDDEEVVPGDDPNSLLSCHKIWDKLQTRPDFKDGTIDIDGLCTELRAKARCSESGVVVDSKDVEAALKRLPDKA